MPTLTANKFNIDYITAGSPAAPCLVFCHGLGGNVDQWQAQVDAFADDYRVIAFSLQGHGNSTKPDDETAYGIAAYAKTAKEVLLALNASPCTWVGNSMGGVIGLALLNQSRIKVTQFVANGTTPQMQYSASARAKMIKADKAMFKLMGFDKYIKFAVNQTVKDAENRKTVAAMMMQTHLLAIVYSHGTLSQYDYIDTLNSANIPITLIRTKDDKAISKSIKKALPQIDNALFSVYDVADYGHLYNMQAPAHYNATLRRILE